MLAPVPAIDVMDSTWLAGRPATVAPIVASAANWPRWWPGLTLTVDELRGDRGVRWHVRDVRTGRRRTAGPALTGSAEVWLEPMFEGVVAHFFLRLDPAPGRRLGRGHRERVARYYRVATKRAFWTLADELDPSRFRRAPGTEVRPR
jgi:hypothetical protein